MNRARRLQEARTVGGVPALGQTLRQPREHGLRRSVSGAQPDKFFDAPSTLCS